MMTTPEIPHDNVEEDSEEEHDVRSAEALL